MELNELVKIGAPLLGAVLGGTPELAAGATSLVIKALGLSDNSSLQDIAKEIQTNPEAAIKFRELEVTYQQYLASVRLQMDQAEYADRANARSREVEITKATGEKDWYPPALGTVVVLAFTLIIGILIFAPLRKTTRTRPLSTYWLVLWQQGIVRCSATILVRQLGAIEKAKLWRGMRQGHLTKGYLWKG